MTMQGDDLERQVEDWLAAEARPMPADLRTAIERIPQRHTQHTRRSWPDASRLSLVAVTAGATALIVVAVLLGTSLLREVRDAVGGPSESNPSSFAPEASEYEWDAMLNFVARNPAGDAYGNATVWTYLSAPAGVRDVSGYVPLPAVDTGEGVRWFDPGVDGLGISTPAGTDRVQMSPSGGGETGVAPIIAWRNPVGPLPLRVAGDVEVDGSCGDGVSFTIAWQGRDGGGEIETAHIARGQDSFDVALDEFHPGDVLYFIVEPGADSACDTTWLRLRITSR